MQAPAVSSDDLEAGARGTWKVRLVLFVIAGLVACPGRPAVVDAGAPRVAEPAVLTTNLDPIDARTFSEPRAPTGLLLELQHSQLGLVFTSERTGRAQVHLSTFDRERALTAGPTANFLQAAAPRRSEVVVTRSDGERERLIAVTLEGRGERELTGWLEVAHRAAVSPDERLVAFETSLTHVAGLGLVNLDGGAVRSLDVSDGFQPAFTGSGSALLITSSTLGDPEIFLQPLDGGARVRLTSFHQEDLNPVPSPDGRRFAFVSNREGVDHVFIEGLDGRGVARATSAPPSVVESDPVWLPDGRGLLITERVDQHLRIARVDVKTRAVMWRSTGPGDDQLPRPSPDGRFIAFVSSRAGNADVWVMRADGTDAIAVTAHASPEYGPAWVSTSALRRDR